jgi:hypothetical protein
LSAIGPLAQAGFDFALFAARAEHRDGQIFGELPPPAFIRERGPGDDFPRRVVPQVLAPVPAGD